MQLLMKNISIGIFHDENLGRELGKKGTESDILMANRKTDDYIFTFMSPNEDKLTAKTQIISTIDAAIISCDNITPELGETILMLDSLGVDKGLFLVPEYSDTTQINNIIKDTNLEGYKIVEKNIPKVLELLETFDVKRNNDGPSVVQIDHSFSVKGVGEVALGVVRQGIIHKHDKSVLLPNNKEIVIRSIQIHDKDYDQAEAGSRVGLAIKGATSDEMNRGTIISDTDTGKIGTDFTLDFVKNKYYPDFKTGVFHATVGMQSLPITITEIKDNKISFKTDKPVCYTKNDKFILIDLNGKKIHFIGTALIE